MAPRKRAFVAALLLIGAIGVGWHVWLASPPADFTYPDGPPAQNRTAVVEYATEYEEAYAWGHRRRLGSDVTPLTLEQTVTNITAVRDGFVVEIDATARTSIDGGAGVGDLPYSVVYKITEERVVRADNLRNRTEPPDLAEGVVVERWNGDQSSLKPLESRSSTRIAEHTALVPL